MTNLHTPFEIEYRHGVDLTPKPVPMTEGQKVQISVLTGISAVVVAAFVFFYGPSAIILFLPAALVASLIYAAINYTYTPPPSLLLDLRFLVCAKTVVYYALIDKVKLTDDTITLLTNNKPVFIIERSRFTSVSRKPVKVKINTYRKFKCVMDELLPRLQLHNPDIQIEH